MVEVISAIACLVAGMDRPTNSGPSADSSAPILEKQQIVAGLYKAEPHNALVFVPGPHPDDKMIMGGEGAAKIKMKRITPELRLVPRKKER